MSDTNVKAMAMDTGTACQEIGLALKYILASQYTARYQNIVKDVPPGLLLQGDNLTQEEWKKGSSVVATLHAYVDLCAEELQVANAGQIPEGVWQNWKEGILAGFRIPAVQTLWKEFFQRGPYEELRKFLNANGLGG